VTSKDYVHLPPATVAKMIYREYGTRFVSKNVSGIESVDEMIWKVYGYYQHMAEWQRKEFAALVYEEMFT
jgi:hypothetical protein